MATYKEAFEADTDKARAARKQYGTLEAFTAAAKKYNATKSEGGKLHTYKTNMKDFAHGSDERRAEYDRRGWGYDPTISAPKGSTSTPSSTAPTTPGSTTNKANKNPNISKLANQQPVTLKGGNLGTALNQKFGANSATSTSNMSLMTQKVNNPTGVTGQKGIQLTTPSLKTQSPVSTDPTSTANMSLDSSTTTPSSEPVSKREAKKRIKAGETPDEIFAKSQDKAGFDKAVSSRAYAKQKRDEGGHSSIRSMKKENQKDLDKQNIAAGNYQDVSRKGKRQNKEAIAKGRSERIERGEGTADDAKFVGKNNKSKTPSARKTRKQNETRSGDNYSVGSIAKAVGNRLRSTHPGFL
jgi:hypothetical protein